MWYFNTDVAEIVLDKCVQLESHENGKDVSFDYEFIEDFNDERRYLIILIVKKQILCLSLKIHSKTRYY